MTKTAKKPAAPKNVAANGPKPGELETVLGDASAVWSAVVEAVRWIVPCELEWLPAKTLAFGRYAVLRHKERRLLYLLPKPGEVEVRVLLGERAYALALNAKLPARIRKLAAAAKVYPEGHYIGIAAAEPVDIAGIATLVKCKLAPKE